MQYSMKDLWNTVTVYDLMKEQYRVWLERAKRLTSFCMKTVNFASNYIKYKKKLLQPNFFKLTINWKFGR